MHPTPYRTALSRAHHHASTYHHAVSLNLPESILSALRLVAQRAHSRALTTYYREASRDADRSERRRGEG